MRPRLHSSRRSKSIRSVRPQCRCSFVRTRLQAATTKRRPRITSRSIRLNGLRHRISKSRVACSRAEISSAPSTASVERLLKVQRLRARVLNWRACCCLLSADTKLRGFLRKNSDAAACLRNSRLKRFAFILRLVAMLKRARCSNNSLARNRRIRECTYCSRAPCVGEVISFARRAMRKSRRVCRKTSQDLRRKRRSSPSRVD